MKVCREEKNYSLLRVKNILRDLIVSRIQFLVKNFPVGKRKRNSLSVSMRDESKSSSSKYFERCQSWHDRRFKSNIQFTKIKKQKNFSMKLIFIITRSGGCRIYVFHVTTLKFELQDQKNQISSRKKNQGENRFSLLV